MANTVITNGVISATKVVASDSITSPTITANSQLIYKGQELNESFAKTVGDNELTGNQTITGDVIITEDITSTGFPGQLYFFNTPSKMMCDVVYDLGVLKESKDLSGIRFANISTHVQTCEIWFETSETVYTVTWPSDSIWPDEIGGIAPAGLMNNTAYRYAVRREPNGTFVITKAYSYPV